VLFPVIAEQAGGKTVNRQISFLLASLLTGLATSAAGQQADQQAPRDIHERFTTAFNRQDAAGLAALFSENGIRVTPQGIVQGRDAIRIDSDKRFQSRFHDLSITPQFARASSDSIWEAGEWTMKIGDQPVRGYFAMTLVRDGDSFKIRDDTFNVAPPAAPGPQPASK
jgi:ketosteroid isomerase-like protein